MKLHLLTPLRHLLAAVLGLRLIASAFGSPLEAGFFNPPSETKPWCYWYWISDHMSKEGITRDLEAMARVGIGEALVGNIFLEDVPAGKIKVLSPEWWSLVEHALREGGRVGVNIGLFNCPGWSQSGGPWIRPEQAMRYLASTEVRVTGPAVFKAPLPAPGQPGQEVAVLAYPAPARDGELVTAYEPRVRSTPGGPDVGTLVDGDLDTAMAFPAGAGQGNTPFILEFELDQPFTAQSLELVPGREPISAQCRLEAAGPDGTFQTVREFKFDRSNFSTGVGFMPRGPLAVAFPATASRRFRLVLTELQGGAQARLAEVRLSGAARLEFFVEKQLGKMHPTPLPLWDAYLWPTQAEPADAQFVIPSSRVQDVSRHLRPDGVLEWEVPPGDWILQRIAMVPTGMKNSPASPEGQGLEVDKMNRELARFHFDAFIGEILRRVPAADRKAFTRVIADSYEMGSQNWTDGFEKPFRKRYGYDPKPWLPVLTGRLVGTADQSERFLWDLRRLVADQVATEYVGGLRAACKPHGLGLWLENYGHWGFPSEFLKYGSESDRIGGEYWVTGDLGSIECRAASSCANTYGKPIVSAESFTGGPPFQHAPGALKARGDWAFCEGINHFVLHVYIHQPWEDRVPGVNAWFGTEFNRHNTWFDRSQAWIEYLRRCCWMLQQGVRVADVAYFIGEDAPKMTGVRQPELPAGRDFDYINGEVIEQSLRVRDGLLTLPHGTSYRVLVLPEQTTMRPALLRAIRKLVRAGATVVGPAPSRSPSLEDYPNGDTEVRRLAAEVWGDQRSPAGERTVGKGRIIWGRTLEEVFAGMNLPPDFDSSSPLRFTHRRADGADIYFVANPKAEPQTVTAAFRVGAKAPELFWPDTARVTRPAVYDVGDGVVRMPLTFGPHGSVFVVFRQPAASAAERIVSVRRNGEEWLGTELVAAAPGGGPEGPNEFTFALWVRPTDGTTLVPETNRGIVGLSEQRNDVFPAPHGDGFGGSGHAGCGLAVGTNGVGVFEHGAHYFAPTLVYAGALTNWTHLAVVYEDGQPRLYLNGRLARRGLRSEHLVHSGASAGVLAQFRGRAGGIEQFARALDDAEVAALVAKMPMPGDPVGQGGFEITLGAAGWEALVGLPGEYEARGADGSTWRFAPALPSPRTLSGPWEVTFSGLGAPNSRVRFEALEDWTRHSEPAIRHFSGRATYTREFDWPGRLPTGGERVVLDLGEVRDLATVRVNGRAFPTRWLAPWEVDITSALVSGENRLEIEVVNVWNNRLVGDAAMPAEQRVTFLLAATVNRTSPLLAAGLLGPVTLRVETVMRR